MKQLLILLALFATACPGPTPPPGTAPKIASTTPPSMAANVSVTTAVVIEFTAPMDPATVAVALNPMVGLATATWNEAKTQATFTHDDTFAFATQYTVRVSGSDPMGLKLAGDTVFAFTTAAAPEATPPTLVSSTPASGSTGVLASTSLVLVFDEAMDTASVQLATLPLFDWGQGVWSANDTTVTFTPPQPLSPSTSYAITVTGADVAGNALVGPVVVNLSTGSAADTTPPTVSSTSPPAGSSGISFSVQPSVSFSEGMSAAVMAVSPDAGCTFTLDGTATLLTCMPTGLLAPSTLYTVTVSGAQSRDLAMNAMGADFTFSFTTGATADTTPPTVVELKPGNALTGVDRDARLTATFSEPMDKASTQGAVSVTSPAGKQLFYAWNDGGTSVVVTVDGGFAYGQAVSWGVSTAAKDLAGLPLGAAASTAFTVRKLCTASVKSDSTVDGTAFAVSTGSSRPAYSYVPTQNRVRIGRSADVSGETLMRGLYVFPFGSATGCVSGGVGRDALAVTSATLRAAQTAVTGTPYAGGVGLRTATVDVDWVPVDLTRFDAGVLFSEVSPCRSASCLKALSSTATTGPKSVDVTTMVQAAVKLSGGQAGYRLPLRLSNEASEALSTRSADYSDFTDGFALDGGATLDVSYEVP